MEIKSNLVGKSYLFESLYIAEKTNLPILLVGERGVGKTQAVLDYMHSNGFKRLFVKQLSPETRADELLGYISIPALKEGRVERIGGLNEADVILIDEIDKASSQVRNLLLSVMRERKIFDGEKFLDCNYKLFVGTANRIPDDEEDIIFIDRFILKQSVERIGEENIGELLNNNKQIYNYDFRNIEEKGNIITYKDDLGITYNVDINKLSLNILTHIYKSISDRTAVQIPVILKTLIRLGYDQFDASVRILELLGNYKVDAIISENKVVKEVIKIYKDYKKDKNAMTKDMTSFKSMIDSKKEAVKSNVSQPDVKENLIRLLDEMFIEISEDNSKALVEEK